MLYIGVGLALLFTALWLLWGNLSIQTTELEVETEGLPAALDGLRVVHISDLHNARFGKDNARLLRALADCDPDIIAVTGDLVDSRRSDVESAMAFMERAAELAPVYYVPGNHEARLGVVYVRMEERMRKMGVNVLHDAAFLWERDGAHIRIAGLDDPAFRGAGPEAALRMLEDDSYCTLLLTHRPEYFTDYAQSGMELVLAGHAHGGQIRLPFLGGLIAPHQGLFPVYDAGLYTTCTEAGKTSMYVSRGLGNSLFPLRIHNRPELVLLRLRAAQA